MLRKTAVTPDEQGVFTFTEIDGKCALVFDSLPSVMLISGDGTDRTTFFFRHGEHIPDITSFNIRGKVADLVEYDLSFCSAIKPE